MDETQDRWVVRENGRFTDIYPYGQPNQYAVGATDDGMSICLRKAPRSEWVAEPRIIDIKSRTFIGRIQPPDVGDDVPGGGAI